MQEIRVLKSIAESPGGAKMPVQKRITHGRAMNAPTAPQARAADAIAMLSGLNFLSVVRVLAAIEALRIADIPLETATRYNDIPLQPVDFSRVQEDDDDAARAESTDKFVCDLISSGKLKRLEYILRIENRFTASN